MNVVRRPGWPLVAVVAMVAGFAAIGLPAPAPAADAPRVLMIDNEPDLTRWHYEPAEVTVPAGSTVVWVNQGREDHTVTADDRSFDSGYKKRGASWQRVFPRPGKYSYHCAPHPWMKGMVVVVAAGTPEPTRAAAADPASSSTTAPLPAATSSTFPASLAAPTTVPPAESATTAPAETTSSTDGTSEEPSAAPAASRDGSGGPLAGTIGIVLLPTLGALALGARLRRSKS